MKLTSNAKRMLASVIAIPAVLFVGLVVISSVTDNKVVIYWMAVPLAALGLFVANRIDSPKRNPR